MGKNGYNLKPELGVKVRLSPVISSPNDRMSAVLRTTNFLANVYVCLVCLGLRTAQNL